ncbi:hypothetical protein TUM17387_16530 [Shewanella carassii]|uniref:hypothetical protein n=1 Tax=Shewanella carassii TaxID=1987584 RepID=UPI001BED9299|nr:hypothetical protein [Shewanella carassii]BCV66294.1 hypothetical protein TUM17387_16530 [Shewanella carassii]
MAKTTTKTMQKLRKNYAKAARNSAKKLRKTATKKAAAATFHCIGITSLDGIRQAIDKL